MDGADTAKIIEQVNKCPSGALSFFYNNHAEQVTDITTATKVEVMETLP